MASITVRGARTDDAQALARIHAEVARYYHDLAPDYFRTLELGVEPRGLDGTTLHLVAEAEGEVVGALVARLLPGEPDTTGDKEPSPETRRLRIEYLATAAESRRRGVGTSLVEAAETWGRAAGATIAETTAYHGSPLSVPFWGERMNYEERSVNLRKAL